MQRHLTGRTIPVAAVLLALLGVACAPRPAGGRADATDVEGGGSGVLLLEPADRDLAGLAWMTGHWAHRQGDLRTEEHWTQPAAGTMLGVSRLMSGDRTVFFEYLRIEKTPEGVFYFASPKGRDPATPFRLVEQGDRRVVFENLEHDFPQRITYWIDEDGALRATTWGEGEEGPREEYFRWQPARFGQ
jgi:hypothetical protein